MRRQGYSINIIEATKKMKENRIETEEQITVCLMHMVMSQKELLANW